jgi:hypothetical protein
MGSAGKYVRHLIGVLVGLVVTAVLAKLAPDTPMHNVQGIVDTISDLLAPAVMLVLYAWTEKLLKRFPALDPEGAASRIDDKLLASRGEAPFAKPPRL